MSIYLLLGFFQFCLRSTRWIELQSPRLGRRGKWNACLKLSIVNTVYVMAYSSFSLVRGIPKTLNLRLYTRRMPCQKSISFWHLSKSRLEFTGFRAYSSLLSDEKKRDLLDERAIFIRDIPPKGSLIQS